MRIHELPPDIVNKIAAGEVVTGCYSVVKELVENALDASATKIEIEIRQGGKEYIRVKDNGSGMTGEEILVAVKPHTTSKITRLDDLDKLRSFGFRGEALSTIASVSRIRVSSKTTDSELGQQAELSGGVVTSQTTVADAVGTSIEVFDLLFNTPARRKFLKSSLIEARMVTETVQRFMLGHPSVSFVYRRDGETAYTVMKTEDMLERVLNVYPDLDREDLLTVDYGEDSLKITGFISMPEKSRGNRLRENLFINGRHVRMPLLNFAVERGYGESLIKGRFPSAILFIDIDTSEIDVNVHPQKLEVRFSETQPVISAIQRAVRETLRGRKSFRVTVKQPESYEEAREIPEGAGPQVNERSSSRTVGVSGYSLSKQTGRSRTEAFEDFSKERFRQLGRRQERANRVSDLEPVGVLSERYILARAEDSLVIIDQHAAHERILFDQLKVSKRFPSQYLTSEIELRLDDMEIETFREKGSHFNDFGFQAELADPLLIVKAIPQMVSSSSVPELVREILDELRLEGLEEPGKVFDNILAAIACKRSIRTGDRLSIEEIGELVALLERIERPVCPHGRPLIMSISFKDLDRFFDR